MADYRNAETRFVDVGLNIMSVSDRIREGEWSRFTNIKPTQEMSIGTRRGRLLFLSIASGLPIHTIKRLDDFFLLIGAGDSLYRNDILLSTGYSGSPVTTVAYTSSLRADAWTYIGDANQMRKLKSDGTDFKWGISPPDFAAEAVAGSAGNLDSSVGGAIGYDWRYTYYSSLSGAESNGSPEMINSVSVVQESADVSVVASDDPQVDTIRLYRRGGVLGDAFRFVMDGPNTDGIFFDNIPDSGIVLNEILSEDNAVPFTSIDLAGNILLDVPMPYVWGAFHWKVYFWCRRYQ